VPYADVKLATDRDGHAWVAFEDRRDERLESLILARVDAQGRVERSRTWPGTAPDIAVASRGAFVSWASASRVGIAHHHSHVEFVIGGRCPPYQALHRL
jgi:hypothetical protein